MPETMQLHASTTFSDLLQEVERFWTPLPDKPEETPERLLAALLSTAGAGPGIRPLAGGDRARPAQREFRRPGRARRAAPGRPARAFRDRGIHRALRLPELQSAVHLGGEGEGDASRDFAARARGRLQRRRLWGLDPDEADSQ